METAELVRLIGQDNWSVIDCQLEEIIKEGDQTQLELLRQHLRYASSFEMLLNMN